MKTKLIAAAIALSLSPFVAEAGNPMSPSIRVSNLNPDETGFRLTNSAKGYITLHVKYSPDGPTYRYGLGVGSSLDFATAAQVTFDGDARPGNQWITYNLDSGEFTIYDTNGVLRVRQE